MEIRDSPFGWPWQISPSSAQNVAPRAVSLRLQQAQLVALVGPSGCGKSTVLGWSQPRADHRSHRPTSILSQNGRKRRPSTALEEAPGEVFRAALTRKINQRAVLKYALIAFTIR